MSEINPRLVIEMCVSNVEPPEAADPRPRDPGELEKDVGSSAVDSGGFAVVSQQRQCVLGPKLLVAASVLLVDVGNPDGVGQLVDDVELVELNDGAVIQASEPGRFVWAQEERYVLNLHSWR